MDIDYKYILGIVTVVMGILAYIPYMKDMRDGKTKPHVFTWFLRGVGSLIVFVGQRYSGAGAGSWSNLIASLLCFIIVIYALFHEAKKYITVSDRIVFAFALVSLVSYYLTDGWFRPMLFINVAEVLAFIPSVRKSRYDPSTETASFYLMHAFKFVLMIFATATYSFATISNTILRLVINFAFALFLYIRRRQLRIRE